jgi:OmpA-OmpF porin, OOP family
MPNLTPLSLLRRPLWVVVAATFVLTACASHGSRPPGPEASQAAMPSECTRGGPVVFLVSGRADSPAPGITGTMQDAIVMATNQGSPIGVVDLDGRPQLTLGVRFTDPTAGNGAALSSDAGTFEDSVASWIARTRARAPHADVLDALQVAGRAVRSACRRGGTVYLEDSGLQETGPMNFRQPGLLMANPADVVSFLGRNHELPTALAGTTVVLIGIGDTAPPQQQLSISEQQNLTAIWSAIIRAAQARVVVDASPRQAAAPAHVPQVLLVSVPTPPEWQPGPGSLTHVFPDSGSVGFEPNTAVFRDPAAARQTLGVLASYLIAHPATRILLTGTTARWGTLAGDIALSLLRAGEVKAVLVSLGASPSQIETRGLGWQFPGYINDQAPGGGLMPGPAEHNRSVIVTSA